MLLIGPGYELVLMDEDCVCDQLVGHIDHIEDHAELDERESGLIVVRERDDEGVPDDRLTTGFYL